MTPGNENPGNGPPDWRQMRDQARMQRRMQMGQWRGQRRGPRPIVPGLVLLIIGALFLLNNLGVFDLREFRTYWPVILIVVGAIQAIFPRHGGRSLLWSGALIVTGG